MVTMVVKNNVLYCDDSGDEGYSEDVVVEVDEFGNEVDADDNNGEETEDGVQALGH
jgi:hypothetical protein